MKSSNSSNKRRSTQSSYSYSSTSSYSSSSSSFPSSSSSSPSLSSSFSSPAIIMSSAAKNPHSGNGKPTLLPRETVLDILSRLPVKSITRFESLSKPFSALIKSPDFISAHLRRSSRHPHLLIRGYHNPSGGDFSIQLLNSRVTSLSDVEVPFLHALSRFPLILGSCNGLVCLDISLCYSSAFVIWNIAAKEFKSLPRPELCDVDVPIWMVATGFGHNCEIDDYKLVRIISYAQKQGELPVIAAEVYSWSSGSWRVVEEAVIEEGIGPCAVSGGQRAVPVNGSLNWLANGVGKLGNQRFIVSFDMGAEDFTRIKIPDFTTGLAVKVLGFKGSLALAVYPVYQRAAIDQFQLWALDDYGPDGKRWSKLHSFSLGIGSPVGVLNGSELLMKRTEGNGFTLSLFDPFTQSIKRLPHCSLDYSCEIFGYVDSLVPVSSGNEAIEDVS